jgi:hypothetical protein
MSTDVIDAELEYISNFLPNLTAKPELTKFFHLKMNMLEERRALLNGVSNSGKSFKTSATKKYLEFCVFHRPGLTRMELKEFAAIPASPKRSETDVFRDYLHALRASIYIDENERCWPRNGLEMPVARIGSVVLDGRVPKTAKSALVFIRDNPGASEASLRRVLKLKTTKAFKSVMNSLKDKVDCDDRGRMFVKGYIPAGPTAILPSKTIRVIDDSVQEQVIDQMDFKVLYDWSELVEVYENLGMTPKQGFQHFTNMVTQGLVGTKNRKYFRIYS